MKQYPLNKHDAVNSIDNVVLLAKNKMAIWHNGWKRPNPAAFFLRMQTAQLLDMIEKGLYTLTGPKYMPSMNPYHTRTKYRMNAESAFATQKN